MSPLALQTAREQFSRGAYAGVLETLSRLDARGQCQAEALLLKGASLARERRFLEAKSVFDELLQIEPDCYEALTWMAILNKNRESIDEAVRYAKRAIELKPDDAAGFGVLGGCYLYQRKPVEAIEALETAAGLALDVAEHRHNLGLAYQMAQRRPEANASFREAIRLAPKGVQSYLALGSHYSLFGIPGRAIDWFKEGLANVPNSPALHTAIAEAFSAIKNDEAAADHYRQAISLSREARGNYAFWLLNQGKFEESESIFNSLLANPASRSLAFYGLMQTKKLKADDLEFVSDMESELGRPGLPPMSRLYLHYALGKASEQLKRFGDSMSHYDEANALAFQIHNAGFPLDVSRLRVGHEHVKACYERLPQRTGFDPRASSPIFIVGMIRSGTTLLEQIVSSHPDVSAAGELRFWIEEGSRLVALGGDRSVADLRALAEEYTTYVELIAGKAERITDKMPLNFAYIGLIRRAMPNARFLHIRRHPVDTCLSIYSTYFGKGPQFAYSKANIASYYRQYLEVMEDWRKEMPSDVLLELDYEELVSNPSTEIRRVIDFCGLPWSFSCLHHEDNASPINTPSRWQARQPVYKSSTDRWRKFEPWLGEFAELLTPSVS